MIGVCAEHAHGLTLALLAHQIDAHRLSADETERRGRLAIELHKAGLPLTLACYDPLPHAEHVLVVTAITESRTVNEVAQNPYVVGCAYCLLTAEHSDCTADSCNIVDYCWTNAVHAVRDYHRTLQALNN